MSKSNQQPDVFFHVGLPKTASTYLQYKVFPKFKGIYYVPRDLHRFYVWLINHKSQQKFLVSREIPNYVMERDTREIAEHFPQTRGIIILRPHDSYIASFYRLQVKNGFVGNFDDFFDLDTDKGFFKKAELSYMDTIKIIEKNFNGKPLVLFLEDLKNDPKTFFDKLVGFMGAEYDFDKISLKPKNTTFAEKKLKFIKKVSPYIPLYRQTKIKNRFLLYLRRRTQLLTSHLLLLVAIWIPKSWLGDEPLVAEDKLQRIRAAYADDWEACREYARANNPV